MSSEYPEHEKMRGVKTESQAIKEFLEWIYEKKRYELTDYYDRPIREKPIELIAEFFEIDLKEVSNEKDRMVDEMRRMNEPSTP